VRVPIEAMLYAGVPGEVLDVLWVRSLGEQDREGAMPLLIPF
jgi:hypothetical protein